MTETKARMVPLESLSTEKKINDMSMKVSNSDNNRKEHSVWHY